MLSLSPWVYGLFLCSRSLWTRHMKQKHTKHTVATYKVTGWYRYLHVPQMTVFLVSFDFNCFTQLLSNWHPRSVHLVSFARQCPFIRVPCCLQNMALVGHACPWLGICVANNPGLSRGGKLCMCWSRGPGCCLSGMHLSQGRSSFLNTWG